MPGSVTQTKESFHMKTILACIMVSALLACGHKEKIGDIERLDPDFDLIVSNNAKIDIIARGMDWSEGPLWIDSLNMLLFSDVPANTIYKWTEKKGKEVYLKPSGYTDSAKRGGETGSNGLLLNKYGQLVLCDLKQLQILSTGKNSIARMMPHFAAMATCSSLIHHMDWKEACRIR